MLIKIVSVMLWLLAIVSSASANNGFVYNGKFELGGLADVSPDGLFMLANSTPFSIGHVFYSLPFTFKNVSNGNASSFSSVFVCALVPDPDGFTGHGLSFVLSPTKGIEGASSSQHLGLFNRTNNGDPSNHIVAIELDTFMNEEFGDINGNHVGIDINSLHSVDSSPAGYFVNGEFKNLTLASGDAIQVWVDYDGVEKQINVTLSPINLAEKPNQPLLSANIDISPYILDEMYVGFSSSTGALLLKSYVLGWSFQMSGKAEELDLSNLPSLPGNNRKELKRNTKLLAILLPVIGSVSAFTILLILYFLRRKSKFAEVLEDWEVKYGPHRFSYKDLYVATKAFSEKELLGRGGFGQVFRGDLPLSKTQIAVKRISHNSKQGMKEFVAEIATIGRLRHPNLVRLLGYCRRKGELFLVYDYMPNASLDKFIFDDSKASINWSQRFSIIKDVASGLAYLHEELGEVIIHRDIKASNVLLDGELNGKLGDFGLARSSYPGKDLETTNLAGTLGYIAPELARNGKANTKTDVFAFGAFCLEVSCGRRPVEPRAQPENVILVDWVTECWKKSEILGTADPKLQNEFNAEQMEMVLKLGLLCTHFVPEVRPSMSQVKRYLDGDTSMLETLNDLFTVEKWNELKDFVATCRSTSEAKESIASVSEMFISSGR